MIKLNELKVYKVPERMLFEDIDEAFNENKGAVSFMISEHHARLLIKEIEFLREKLSMNVCNSNCDFCCAKERSADALAESKERVGE